MRKTDVVSAFLALVLGLSFMSVTVGAQVGTGPKTLPRDPEMEKKSNTDLEAGTFYIKSRKKYKAGIDRLEDIQEHYPEYSRMDLVYFWLGEAHAGLSRDAEKAGKKDDVAKERAKAIEYYKLLVKEFPDGEKSGDAKKALKELGAEG
jgi:TolA-binding protein